MAGEKHLNGTGSPQSLTRLLRRRVKSLVESNRMPSLEALYRAMSDAVDDVIHSEQTPVSLARKEEALPATVYASPNDRDEPSTLQDAGRHFLGDKHSQQVKLASRATDKPAEPAVGVWTDGAEESTVASVAADKARRVAALLGLHGRQKQVLVFTPSETGPATRYTVQYTPTNFGEVVSKFLGAGVPHATHFMAGPLQTSVTHVVDTDGSLRDVVHRAAQNLPGGHVTAGRGVAEFLGHESSREEAAKIFRKILGKS